MKNQDLSAGQIKDLYKVLKISSVEEIILKTAQIHRTLMIYCLDQEGLTDGAPYEIVDIGWVGVCLAPKFRSQPVLKKPLNLQ
ncbi:MAG: hypothetical protein M3512_17485 [Bacteroidota bacterium]|nr:hypothetical protein [Bacteroidota bacterium]